MATPKEPEENGSKKKTGFLGILKSFDNLLNKEEYRENDEPKEELNSTEESAGSPVQVIQPIKFERPKNNIGGDKPKLFAPNTSANLNASAPVISPPSQAEIEATAKEIYDYLESINEDGIDFIEFWNGVEELGGCSQENLDKTFKVLYSATGKKLTKEFLIQSARSYKEKISYSAQADLGFVEEDKKKLVQARDEEKSTLEDDIQRLTDEINERIAQKEEKQKALLLINGKHDPEINKVSRRIMIRKQALQSVLEQMDQVAGLINNIQK